MKYREKTLRLHCVKFTSIFNELTEKGIFYLWSSLFNTASLPLKFHRRMLGLKIKFHCVGGCWDWRSDSTVPEDAGIEPQIPLCRRMLELKIRFHCVGGCWDWTSDSTVSEDAGIEPQIPLCRRMLELNLRFHCVGECWDWTSDSTVSEDAGIEPQIPLCRRMLGLNLRFPCVVGCWDWTCKAASTFALAVRRSNNSARSHPTSYLIRSYVGTIYYTVNTIHNFCNWQIKFIIVSVIKWEKIANFNYQNNLRETPLI